MKILTIILAREGSKRIPNKNIKSLNGKPLVLWTIDVAKQCTAICDILVSTDSKEIVHIANSAGVLAPWLRPSNLSSDNASSVDSVIHGLDWYETNIAKVDGVMLLQPTSPFRSLETLNRGIKLFMNNNSSVIAVSLSTKQIECLKIINKEGFLCDVFDRHRSKDIQNNLYLVNGSLYIANPNIVRNNKSFYDEKTIPLIINSEEESLDIDTYFDWMLAEAIVQRRKQNPCD